MEATPKFPVLLRLIEEHSIAFRAAVSAAPDLEPWVPTCPEWTLRDLTQHLSEVHRFWAGVVLAGPATAPPPEPASDGVETAPRAPREREELLAWSAASTQLLLDALREVGPDRGCWTWWGESQSPQTAGAVARHQLQEIMVHTYDAEITVGTPQPLPDEAALDGVDEFLTTCCEGTDPWPHEAAVIDFHATEGRSWRLSLSAAGTRTTRLPAPGTTPETGPGTAAGTAPDAADGQSPDVAPASASARGTAADLVLSLHRRIPIDSLRIDGDRRHLELFRDWD